MPKHLRPALNTDQKFIVDLVVAWKSTPVGTKKASNLAALAKDNGLTPNTRFYELANSSDVYHNLLIGEAGRAIDELPAVLTACATRAKDGSPKHIEIYLNFVRQTLTDNKMMSTLRPEPAMVDAIAQTMDDVAQIKAMVAALPATEAEARKLQAEAVEAEYEETE